MPSTDAGSLVDLRTGGGDRHLRQREPDPQGGAVVSPRGVDAVRRGAPDPGRAIARAGARHGA